MEFRSKITAVAVAVGATAAVVGAAPAQAAPPPPNGSICAIQTSNGRFVTAVGGGGRITGVMRTDATGVGPNEKFTLESVGDGVHVDLRTRTANYVTAVNSGGLTHNQVTDVLHTDAVVRGTWELLELVGQGDGTVGIRLFDRHFLTAVDGGGHSSGAFDSNRTSVQSWEKFRFICGFSS
ncbi:fascin domain-containing protein [Actinoplanes sp. HUAS TT8]|uniref:fascin domain-containing protein n=1 Tax=Actinoplanes sp. HUAS TT8 TaxID=3447453 RepID=UPI003F520771